MDALLDRVKYLAASARYAEAAEAALALAKWLTVVGRPADAATGLAADLIALRDATITRRGLKVAYRSYRRNLAKLEEAV